MKTTFRFSVLLVLLFCATVVRAQSQQCAYPSAVHQTPDKVTNGSYGSHQYIASQTVTYIVTCINNLQPGTTYGSPQTNQVTATGDYSPVFGACNPTFGTAVQYDSNSWTASKFENLGYPSHDTSDAMGHDLGCKPGMTQETDTLCQPQACPTSTCSPPGAAPTCTDGSDAVWDTSTCSWTCASGFCPNPHCLCDPSSPDPCCCGGSPILIDTGGQGFALTNAQSGVQFDISGKGNRFQIGWTAPGAQNAFLCLPDANGCNSGKQLFGNFTPQPPSSTLNGFAALAVYDLPANGGNGDGIIDSRDAIFSRLRLWIDANHDGISQPNELFSLPQLGVTSISLNYKWDQRTDQYGNIFRYRAAVGSTDGAGRMAYDVFFVMQTSGTAATLKACPPRPLLMKTPAEKKTLLR